MAPLLVVPIEAHDWAAAAAMNLNPVDPPLALEETMNAAEQGDELADFVRDDIDANTTNDAERRTMGLRVLRRLAKMGIEELPKSTAVVPPKAMTDVQTRTFDASIVPLGKHRGAVVAHVPLSYFHILSDPSEWKKEVEEWMSELARYLASDRIQRESDDRR